MSLYGTIYGGTTGLVTFSKGLDVISNNVANMNTPGFKRNDLLFRDLFYNYQLLGDSADGFSGRRDGNGVGEGGTVTVFSQGDIQQSGNDTDVAINGNGLFVLREGNQSSYTRVGQFQVDSDGYLVSSINGARVAGIDEAGNLQDIDVSGFRTNPAQATSEVSFFDNLSSGATSHVINDIEVFDVAGNTHNLSLTLTNNSSETPRSWLLRVENEEGDVIADELEIRFEGNGSPAEGFNEVEFSFEPDDAPASTIKFSFGEPGTFTGATSFSAGSNSDLKVENQDGRSFGSQLSSSFNEKGSLVINYTNGETVEVGTLAFAWLNETQLLKQSGQGLFTIDQPGLMTFGRAGEGVMGDLAGRSVEISNVDLSQEFTDLVIVQRSYQVSSQVVSIANEMIQQLLDTAKGGR